MSGLAVKEKSFIPVSKASPMLFKKPQSQGNGHRVVAYVLLQEDFWFCLLVFSTVNLFLAYLA